MENKNENELIKTVISNAGQGMTNSLIKVGGNQNKSASEDARVSRAKEMFKSGSERQQKSLAYASAIPLINTQRSNGTSWLEIVKVINKTFRLGLDLSTPEKVKSEGFTMANQVRKYNKASAV